MQTRSRFPRGAALLAAFALLALAPEALAQSTRVPAGAAYRPAPPPDDDEVLLDAPPGVVVLPAYRTRPRPLYGAPPPADFDDDLDGLPTEASRPPAVVGPGRFGAARGPLGDDGGRHLRPPAELGRPGGPAVAALPPDGDEELAAAPREIPPHLRRQMVRYPTREPAGTVIVDTGNTYLYYVLGNGQAVRYGIGVGREGFTWTGHERISRKAEWPDWHPPASMIERQPYLPRFMAGGPHNPLGARALYLGSTLYRIHGSNEPHTIGQFVSSGCIRMLNEDVEDLYRRVSVGTQVVVLPSRSAVSARAGGRTQAR